MSTPTHTTYTALIDTILDHIHTYNILHAPTITDAEYDDLYAQLVQIETDHPEWISSTSPTQSLIGQDESIQSGFAKADHHIRLMSLENTYNQTDILTRCERMDSLCGEGSIYIVQPKFDGIAVAITYIDGILTQAITRGDGLTGDDITTNIMQIANIPHRLTGDHTGEIIVRGEIIMPISVWKQLNTSREAGDEPVFANPRNAAAGTIKLLDAQEVKKRGLVGYMYDVLVSGCVTNTSLHIESDYTLLRTRGLPTLDREQTCTSSQSVIDLCTDSNTKKSLEVFDCLFDGLVIKLASKEMRTHIGETNHHPRWAIAYKFPALQVATILERVEWQVGRTGVLTPVGYIEPVTIAGVTIRRVSVHNRDNIQTKKLALGRYILLQRSGEVIPYIVSSIPERDTDRVQDIPPPSLCPSCQNHTSCITTQVGTKKDPTISTQYICTNPACPGILVERLKHFVSRDAMNIASMGESIIQLLVEKKILSDIQGLYTLVDPSIRLMMTRLPGIGRTKIDKLSDEITASQTNPLYRLLYGLGVAGVGVRMAQVVAPYIQTCLDGEMMTIEGLRALPGVGEVMAREILAWWTSGGSDIDSFFIPISIEPVQEDVAFGGLFG